jgi:hypothetical protein
LKELYDKVLLYLIFSPRRIHYVFNTKKKTKRSAVIIAWNLLHLKSFFKKFRVERDLVPTLALQRESVPRLFLLH